jgi:hypothetical protein
LWRVLLFIAQIALYAYIIGQMAAQAAAKVPQ